MIIRFEFDTSKELDEKDLLKLLKLIYKSVAEAD